MPAIAAQASDCLAIDFSAKLVDRPAAGSTDTLEKASTWDVVTEALSYGGMIYVPVVGSLCGKVISLFHDNSKSGHLELLMLMSWYLGISTSQQWTRMYVGMTAAERYATKSKLLDTPDAGSACPWRHHHGHGKEGWCTWSPNWQTQRNRATLGISWSWTDRHLGRSTYHASRISTWQNWPGVSLNTSSSSMVSGIP